MLKSNKGVSLMTVVITVIVMLVIISITISTSIRSVQEANITKIDNEIKDLKEATSARSVNYERNPLSYPLIGEKIGDNIFEYIRTIEHLEIEEKNQIINQILLSYSNETLEYYRLVGKMEAEELGVEGLDQEHYYVVDYYDCEVYGPVSLAIVNS